MEKYKPKKGELIFSKEEIELLHRAEEIIGEAAAFVYEYALHSDASNTLNNLECRLSNFCTQMETAEGKLSFDVGY